MGNIMVEFTGPTHAKATGILHNPARLAWFPDWLPIAVGGWYQWEFVKDSSGVWRCASLVNTSMYNTAPAVALLATMAVAASIWYVVHRIARALGLKVAAEPSKRPHQE